MRDEADADAGPSHDNFVLKIPHSETLLSGMVKIMMPRILITGIAASKPSL